MSDTESDRYISFCNIACDENADTFIAILDEHIKCQDGAEKWQQYFAGKRAEQKNMGHDNLHFIGNQLNPLYEYMTNCKDDAAIDLLYQLEQECC